MKMIKKRERLAEKKTCGPKQQVKIQFVLLLLIYMRASKCVNEEAFQLETHFSIIYRREEHLLRRHLTPGLIIILQ